MNFGKLIRSLYPRATSKVVEVLHVTRGDGEPRESKKGQDAEWKRRLDIADHARDTGRFREAAELFLNVLEIREDRGIRMQVGHMYKEARNFEAARQHYDIVYAADENDPEISLQLGHFCKVQGRYEDALSHYRRASELSPDWESPRREVEAIEWSDDLRLERRRSALLSPTDAEVQYGFSEYDLFDPLLDGSLIAQSYEDLCVTHQPAFVPTRNGTPQTSEWGKGLTVRGISALRGYLVSSVHIDRVDIIMDGELIHSENLTIATQPREKTNKDIRKYCYNAWIDFTDVESGWHDFVFRAVAPGLDEAEGKTWRRERLIVAPPFETAYYNQSDAVLETLDKDTPLTLVEQINARPSVLHRCTTQSFPFDVKTVAVLRPDQLGDLVASVPALQKIRAALPRAKLVGLLSRANEGLARSLGIFDEIIVVNFPDDPVMRDRVMSIEDQIALKKALAPFNFDLAIDLPVSANSHKLLPLLGAPLTMGFGGPRKSIDLNFSSYDPSTGCDFVKHSARTAIIGDAVALAADSGARVIRRNDLSRETLVPYGVPAQEPYIVIHSGARIKFTHWPHYTELAERVVRHMGMRVVYMAENTDQKSRLPADLLDSGGIVYVSGQMPFDHFDTFLSFSSAFIGNDSGPKHLASLRGTQVVSLHSSRIGWQEWGQERGGIAISRRVPCAGCSLHHNYDECAKDVACIRLISVDEVYSAISQLLSEVHPS
ncbi:hypothetical protein AA103196_0576 [Ameyamaea chiangmaiensis NBRC 103196]|uniref:Tetratricopeptide repeat protein n=1 Tax=Ameyamaea chiangmaiensis TaxID=442969 RepID=A0A850PDA9_9PROT|nr:glycosyltransferase family 9 protein [Ameyamaea chiangmaiensis]MBS4076413.1 hypothetical protein [Ameyamaea chiangmaiensis]NVN40659.1 hypothetical protein [Ameyamaea chiangmaiensis]GBQ63390.1 hypothetical protein AA103196_0576 [Ameyamaea chiangmaiensis NBRC 103196]